MTTRLILVCHGSTEALRTVSFPTDEPLDSEGRLRAATLARTLPKASQCWTSPEARTRQTAQALQLSADIEPMLRECDYGAWAGRALSDVYTHEPTAVSAWLNDPTSVPHGGEAIASLMARVDAWLTAAQAHRRESIIVTHPTIIRAAIVRAIGAPPSSFWRIDITPLSVTRLSGSHGRWNLAATGCTEA